MYKTCDVVTLLQAESLARVHVSSTLHHSASADNQWMNINEYDLMSIRLMVIASEWPMNFIMILSGFSEVWHMISRTYLTLHFEQ